jgi:hypothetical protein
MTQRWTLWIKTLQLLALSATASLLFAGWRFSSSNFLPLRIVEVSASIQAIPSVEPNVTSTTFSVDGRLVDDALQQVIQRFRNPPRFFPNATTTQPIKVFYFSLFPKMVNDDVAKHFVLDGINRSPYLQLITEDEGGHKHWRSDPNIVWLASSSSLWNRPGAWCVRLSELILEAQEVRLAKNTKRKAWPIHVLNWADSYETFPCIRTFNVSKKSVYYHKRSLVWDRQWNATTNTIENGRIHYYDNWTLFSAAPVHHIPFCVRSDLVDALQTVSETEFNYSRRSENLTFADWDITNAWHRSVDVSHFWPATGPGVDRGHIPLSQLRDAVSSTLDALGRSNNISTFAALAGEAKQAGRSQVHLEYARRLLQSKIVVVAQKDEWEDHYRLMEGLASGALVLSDVMLTLPQGLVDGKSLVFYRNQSHLVQLVSYYLSHDQERLRIAREGRRVAMTMHRSWHRMEEVVFGRILSLS